MKITAITAGGKRLCPVKNASHHVNGDIAHLAHIFNKLGVSVFPAKRTQAASAVGAEILCFISAGSAAGLPVIFAVGDFIGNLKCRNLLLLLFGYERVFCTECLFIEWWIYGIRNHTGEHIFIHPAVTGFIGGKPYYAACKADSQRVFQQRPDVVTFGSYPDIMLIELIFDSAHFILWKFFWKKFQNSAVCYSPYQFFANCIFHP